MADAKEYGKRVRQQKYQQEGKLPPKKATPAKSVKPAKAPLTPASAVPTYDLSQEFTGRTPAPATPTGPQVSQKYIQQPMGFTEEVKGRLAQQKTAAPKAKPIAPNPADFPDLNKWTNAMMEFEAKYGPKPIQPKMIKPTQPAAGGMKNFIARLLGRSGSKAMFPAIVGGAAGAATFGLPELTFAQDVGAPTMFPTGGVQGTNIAPQMFRGFQPNPFMTIGPYGEQRQGVVGNVPGVAGFDYIPQGISAVPAQQGVPMPLPQQNPLAYDDALMTLQRGEPFSPQGIRNTGMFEAGMQYEPWQRSLIRQGR